MLLEVKEVSKKYGTISALNPLSCCMESGELIGLVGSNGAGKSTLIKILSTLIRPTSGDVLLDGRSIVKNPSLMQKKIGYLPQDAAFYPNLSAVEFLMYLSALKKIPKKKAREEVEAFLEALHLSDVRNKRLSDCSGGMKQRVGIAGALLGNPEIIIVDEPTTGLDPEERVALRNILSTLACTKLVLLSTHIISDIEAAATKIMVLKKGNLLFCDTPETLLHYAQGHVWEYILPKSRRSEGLSGVSSMLQTKEGIKIRQGSLSVLAAFLFVPDSEAEMTSIAVDADYFLQGTNWTWIPMASALCTGMLLPLAGFFYLRNTLSFDRKTGTMALVYTSPVRRVSYLTGKYISNLLLLILVLVVVVVSSLCMMLIHFPGSGFSVLHFLSFFAGILPGIFLCAAVALMAEAVPLLQGRSGSWLAGVWFFVMYIVCISSLVDDPQGVMARFIDMIGFVWLKDSIDRSVYSVTGKPAQVALGVHQDLEVSHRELAELFFQPLLFTQKRVLEKGVMIVGGIVISIAASAILPRYESGKKTRMVSEKKRRNTDGHGLFATEAIQTLRSCSVPWALVMAGLWLSMFVADRKTAYGTLWVLAMMWSCLLYADYGCREKKYNMDTLLPTFYHACSRQMLVRWCVGAMLSVLISVPVILRAALAGNGAGATAAILSACFVPALSIFLGRISGSERAFEIVFLVIGYWMLNSAFALTLIG